MSHNPKTPQTKYDQFLDTWSGRELLKRHSLDEEGVWEVLGEDPNCDFGGYHHSPRLGIYEGRLRDIIEKAVVMPSFWTWGAGGDVRLVEIKTVKTQDEQTKKRIIELKDHLYSLEQQQKEVKKRLKDLEG